MSGDDPLFITIVNGWGRKKQRKIGLRMIHVLIYLLLQKASHTIPVRQES